MKLLTNTTVAIILNICVSNHHIVYLNLTQFIGQLYFNKLGKYV